MSFKDRRPCQGNELVRVPVPQENRTIITHGGKLCHIIRPAAESNTGDGKRVLRIASWSQKDISPRIRDVPQPDRFIITGGNKNFTVEAEGQAVHKTGMFDHRFASQLGLFQMLSITNIP